MDIDDRVIGKGLWIYANLDTYEGQFLDGLKHGFGVMTYTNGR